MNNIETSFRQIRLFALVFICLCALVTGFAVWNSYSFAEKQRQKIYVLDNGKSLMLALSQDMAQNRPVEAKSHVRRFHELFFTLSPDKGAIESNIKRSLFLADKTAFNYYKDLAEKGYYNRVISGNVTQTVEIDSVKCDFAQFVKAHARSPPGIIVTVHVSGYFLVLVVGFVILVTGRFFRFGCCFRNVFFRLSVSLRRKNSIIFNRLREVSRFVLRCPD